MSATTQPESTPGNPTPGIEITGDHNPLQFFFYLLGTKLTVEIDGQADHGPWRQPRFYPAAPGEHRVRVSFRYLGSAKGTVETMVNVPSDAVVRMLYKAPQVVTGSGRLKVTGS